MMGHFIPHYQLLNQKENDYYKTGTLSDVRTRAGYLAGSDGRLYPYVIMVNKSGVGYSSILKEFKKSISRY